MVHNRNQVNKTEDHLWNEKVFLFQCKLFHLFKSSINSCLDVEKESFYVYKTSDVINITAGHLKNCMARQDLGV